MRRVEWLGTATGTNLASLTRGNVKLDKLRELTNIIDTIETITILILLQRLLLIRLAEL
jgi:hypothetical protein